MTTLLTKPPKDLKKLSSNPQKKTLPHWKYWKKTERLQNFLSKSEVRAGGARETDETVAELIVETPVPEELKYLLSIHLSNWLYMRPLERLSLVDRP